MQLNNISQDVDFYFTKLDHLDQYEHQTNLEFQGIVQKTKG